MERRQRLIAIFYPVIIPCALLFSLAVAFVIAYRDYH